MMGWAMLGFADDMVRLEGLARMYFAGFKTWLGLEMWLNWAEYFGGVGKWLRLQIW